MGRPRKESHPKLAENVRIIRMSLGESQKKFGQRWGMSENGVRRWEMGENTPPLARLIDLCDLSGLTLDRLVGYKRKPKPAA